MGKWNPNDYSLTDQIKDIARGWDVSTGDEGCVIKVRPGAGKAFVPADNSKGHDHYELKDGNWVKC